MKPKYKCKVVPSVASYQLGEVVICNSSSFYYMQLYDDVSFLKQIKSDYLEQAKYLIDVYYDMIASGEPDLYQAARLLSKATFAVRQAKNIEWHIQEKSK